MPLVCVNNSERQWIWMKPNCAVICWLHFPLIYFPVFQTVGFHDCAAELHTASRRTKLSHAKVDRSKYKDSRATFRAIEGLWKTIRRLKWLLYFFVWRHKSLLTALTAVWIVTGRKFAHWWHVHNGRSVFPVLPDRQDL